METSPKGECPMIGSFPRKNKYTDGPVQVEMSPAKPMGFIMEKRSTIPTNSGWVVVPFKQAWKKDETKTEEETSTEGSFPNA